VRGAEHRVPERRHDDQMSAPDGVVVSAVCRAGSVVPRCDAGRVQLRYDVRRQKLFYDVNRYRAPDALRFKPVPELVSFQ
jgi:hypothetical protein